MVEPSLLVEPSENAGSTIFKCWFNQHHHLNQHNLMVEPSLLVEPSENAGLTNTPILNQYITWRLNHQLTNSKSPEPFLFHWFDTFFCLWNNAYSNPLFYTIAMTGQRLHKAKFDLYKSKYRQKTLKVYTIKSCNLLQYI